MPSYNEGMNAWSMRTGKTREFEAAFLDHGRIYLTWHNFNRNLRHVRTNDEINRLLREVYPQNSPQKIGNHGGQMLRFVHDMAIGDAVIIHGVNRQTVHIGRITSDYVFDKDADNPFYHWRDVLWLAQQVEREWFDDELQSKLGHQSTIAQLHVDDAAKRVFGVMG